MQSTLHGFGALLVSTLLTFPSSATEPVPPRPVPDCAFWMGNPLLVPAQTRVHFARPPHFSDLLGSNLQLSMTALKAVNDEGEMLIETDVTSAKLRIAGVGVFERAQWNIAELTARGLAIVAENAKVHVRMELEMSRFLPPLALQVFKKSPGSGGTGQSIMSLQGHAVAFKVDLTHSFYKIQEFYFGRSEQPKPRTADDAFFDRQVLGSAENPQTTALHWISGLSPMRFVPFGEAFPWFALVDGLADAARTQGVAIRFPVPRALAP